MSVAPPLPAAGAAAPQATTPPAGFVAVAALGSVTVVGVLPLSVGAPAAGVAPGTVVVAPVAGPVTAPGRAPVSPVAGALPRSGPAAPPAGPAARWAATESLTSWD